MPSWEASTFVMADGIITNTLWKIKTISGREQIFVTSGFQIFTSPEILSDRTSKIRNNLECHGTISLFRSEGQASLT